MDGKFENSLIVLLLLLVMLAISGIINAGLLHRLQCVKKRTAKKLALKSASLAILSHEIRNPLVGVVTVARALSNTPLDDTQRHLLDTLDDSGNALLTLLDNTLQQSRLETGSFTVTPSDFSIASLVNRITSMLDEQAAAKGLVLSANIDRNLPAILHGDSGGIRQILLNLLSNAIKFTDSGIVKLQIENAGKIGRAEKTGEFFNVTFRVIDSGIGIPANQLEQIFLPFAQGDTTIQQRFGGSGLGLSISQRLANAMGGNITVDSEEGRGSVFTLSLPLQAQDMSGCEILSMPGNTQILRIPQRLQLLVADDTEIHRVAMRSLLEADGHQVTLASSANQALALIATKGFDCVLLDVHMPGLNCISAIDQLRATDNAPGIIALSAWLDDHEVNCLLDAGADAICYKPLDPRVIKQVLDRMRVERSRQCKMTTDALSRRHSSRIS